MLQGARRFQREPRLSDSRWPHERHHAVLAQQLGQLRELLAAIDERRRGRWDVAASLGGNWDRGDRRVVHEDRLLKAAQLRPGLEREPLAQQAPRFLERLERVDLSTAPVEGEHQLAPEPLAERVLLERRAQRRHELAVLPERERGVEPFLDGIQAERLEPPCLGCQRGDVGEALQGGAAPEGERAVGRDCPGTGIALTESRAGVREQPLEAQRVDRHLRQRISVGGADDAIVAERSPKPCNVVLDSVAWRRRYVRFPKGVDQRVDSHRAAATQGEDGKEPGALGGADAERPPAGQYVERAENPDLQRVAHTRGRFACIADSCT
jgi:hypothetical protein